MEDIGIRRRLLFATMYLSPDIPQYWDTVAKFANLAPGEQNVTPESAKLYMENLQVLNPSAFISDTDLTNQLVQMEYSVTKQPLGITLVPNQTNCSSCNGQLLMRNDRPSVITLYTESMGTICATHFHKYCQNNRKGCKFVQYYGYHKCGSGCIEYNDDWMSLSYFVSSQETGFEMLLLKRLDTELLIGQISYKQKADIYNISKEYDTTKKECSTSETEKPDRKPPVHSSHPWRQQMDRRRLEAAHIKYACLQMTAAYPELRGVKFEEDVMNTLDKITPMLFSSFESRYAAHKCNFPGCRSVLVVDGNMKNRRDVCFAKDAGFIQFDGLPGSIKTGCTATPAFKSRYCHHHIKQACTLQVSEEIDDEMNEPTGPMLRSNNISKKTPGDPIAEIILGKKTTRKQTYYQVLWLGTPECHATWEPSTSIPKALIDDFETGSRREPKVDVTVCYGHISSTVILSQINNEQPEPKKSKQEQSCHENMEGSFQDIPDKEPLTCRTEKDRGVRLNHRTAGILAGMRPCGVITCIRELFNAESKSQVYGHLHQFLQNNSEAALQLKYICYDDGCHLKKYADNKQRCGLTPTTNILSNVSIVIDKMHMAGHVDKWCKSNCDPRLYPDLNKVDTEVCEQVFSWLSRYKKMTTKMNRHTYMFFLLYICELHNRREIDKLTRSNFM